MELTDILSKEEWKQFEDELFEKFQIFCTVYDTSGTSITGNRNWCNKLCPQIKANKDALSAICASSNQYFMAQAKQTQDAVIEECDAGLMKIAVPITVEGKFMGTAGGCGLLPDGGEVETFLIGKIMGLSEEEILAYCEDLETISQERAKEIASFIENRIRRFIDNYQQAGTGA